MYLQELVDYYDLHPEHQVEILANSLEYWQMELNEMIEKLGK